MSFIHAPWIDHLESRGSPSFVDIPKVNPFHNLIPEVTVTVINTNFTRKVFSVLGSGRNKFSNFLNFFFLEAWVFPLAVNTTSYFPENISQLSKSEWP